MKKAMSEILWELIPHENKFVITEKDLLDYITNLQHTEDLYNQLLKDYDDLQQENERLKDQNINEILKKDLEICAKQYKKSDEKLEKYKSRIEKAVEFINKHCVNHKISKVVGFKVYTMMVTDELEKVMKILENGRSDE